MGILEQRCISIAYEFDFDLTKVSRSFFRRLAKFSDHWDIHRKIGGLVESIIDRFNIQKITGLPFSDAVKVIDDLVDIYAKNLSQEEEFKKSKNRALLLPHCSRKYMDQRCQATFDSELSTYECQHCSEDCLINRASKIGEEEGYDVYVLPGGSCIPKILKKGDYSGVVGVACPHEIQLGLGFLENTQIPYQSVPLLRNGCSNTEFNLETFQQIL